MKISRLRLKPPAMVWAELESSEAFNKMYGQAHQEVAKMDPAFVWVAEEMRAPHPHITLARLGRETGGFQLQPLAAPIDLPVDRIDLMKSTLSSTGPVYEVIETYELKNR